MTGTANVFAMSRNVIFVIAECSPLPISTPTHAVGDLLTRCLIKSAMHPFMADPSGAVGSPVPPLLLGLSSPE